jgi:hypothetical protein
MNAGQLAVQAKQDIETLGGISIRTGMALEALGYDVERLEESIKVMIKKGNK